MIRVFVSTYCAYTREANAESNSGWRGRSPYRSWQMPFAEGEIFVDKKPKRMFGYVEVDVLSRSQITRASTTTFRRYWWISLEPEGAERRASDCPHEGAGGFCASGALRATLSSVLPVKT